jgi:Arc/MetJ-type ribon-helix-helix transcriptional regulator
MRVELKPETERLVQEEIQLGHFHSVDEVIVQGVYALREKSKVAPAPPRKPRKNLADFLSESPFAGSEIHLERQQDHGRPVDL